MRQFKFIAVLVLVALFACSKDGEVKREKEMEVENGVPKFMNMEAFFHVAVKAQQMTDEDRIQWEIENKFYSLQSFYQEAWEEYENLGSYEEYLVWRDQNQDFWQFEENEAFFSLPIKRYGDSFVTDIHGQVIINNVYHDLSNLSDSFYKQFNDCNLKSIPEEASTCAKNDGKRRVEVKLENQGLTTFIKVEGFKKYLWKWNRYTTKLYFKFEHDYSIDGYSSNCITVERSNGPASFDDNIIVDNQCEVEGKSVLYRFFTPDGLDYTYTDKYNLTWDVKDYIGAHGWTRGVGEDSKCQVRLYSSFLLVNK